MISPDSPCYNQVRLLVRTLPIVANEQCFALKGGTAINLFVREMPRLSVDIDLTYLPVNERNAALEEIDVSLGRIQLQLSSQPYGYNVRVGKRQDGKATGLLISSDVAMIKIEVSPVLRGAVYPCSTRRIVEPAEVEFGFAAVPVVSMADLYAGKIVAALDRQHPRDLFDIMLLLSAEGINDDMFRAFLVYLISHDGSIARVLNPTNKPLDELFKSQFVGMTRHNVSIDDLHQTRTALIATIRQSFRERDKLFLTSFMQGKPIWDYLGIPHTEDLPAVRWKLMNIARMTPTMHSKALNELDTVLGNL